MNPRTTWLGLLVLVALGAFVWFYEIEGAPEREAAEAGESKVFLGLEPGDVGSLVLRTTDGVDATLQRAEAAWVLTAPLEFPADTLAADGIVRALTALESETAYDEIEALESYGLDGEPILRFRVDGAERAIRIGARTPVGSGVYVTDEAGVRVWVVEPFRTRAFEKSLLQLRERRVVDFDSSTLRGLRVSWPEARVELARSGGEEGGEGAASTWALEHPLAAPARERTVSDLLSDLRFLRAEAFVDEPSAEQLASFEAPAYAVEIRTEDGDEPLPFEVGAAGSAGRRLARGPSGAIVEIANASYEDLPRRVVDFRFRELARFLPSEVERFTLSFAGGSVPVELEARRSEARSWQFGAEALAPGAASRILSELSRLEASDVAAEAMGPDELAALGLAPARARVRVWGEQEAPLADVSLGTARADGALAAQRAGSEIVYWLDAGVANEIPVSASAFRSEFQAADEPEPEPSDAEPSALGVPPTTP